MIFITTMILAASLGSAKAYIDHQLGVELNRSLKSIADMVTIDYSEVSTSLLGSAYIRNMHLSMPGYAPVLIDTITLYKAYQFSNPKKLPQQISIAIQGVQFPISDTATPAPILVSALGYAPYYFTLKELRHLGYARINANIDIELKQQGEKKISLWGSINGRSWGELTLSTDLTNSLAITSLLTQQIQLTALTFSYTDNGLFNRLFTMLAQRNKMTVAHLKQSLINKLKGDLSQITLDASILSSLQQFIQTPDKLTILMQPKSPITRNTLLLTSPKHLGLKMTARNSN
ncbi:MAG: hypothetical protein KAI83_03245 [Thiomargarita sp.]|nr:hypothetical protein [Thiomargarita sp.]